MGKGIGVGLAAVGLGLWGEFTYFNFGAQSRLDIGQGGCQCGNKFALTCTLHKPFSLPSLIGCQFSHLCYRFCNSICCLQAVAKGRTFLVFLWWTPHFMEGRTQFKYLTNKARTHALSKSHTNTKQQAKFNPRL